MYGKQCEQIRHTRGMKELYGLRKETIERDFGTAKENHGMRYTTCVGKARMRMKVRANICVHEHEEIGENTGWKGRKRLITGCPKRACSPG